MTRKAPRKLLKGDKFNGRHATIIEGAEKFVEFAKKLNRVSKISIGPINPAGKGPPRLRITENDHAIKATVRGKTAVQSFYLYGDVPKIAEALMEYCSRDYFTLEKGKGE